MSMPALTATTAFDDAARQVLRHLRDHVPMGFWSVTRVENGRQTYLYLDDNDYGLVQGGSHPWEDSFCIRLADGVAPSVAPVVSEEPAFVGAAVQEAVPIGAYAGAVIREPTGELFGAICGIHPVDKRDDPALAAAAPLLALLGQLLSLVLAGDRTRDALVEQVVQAELAAQTDVLTGLYNRRAWERLLDAEGRRFARLGDPTVVVMVDLDGLKEVNDVLGHSAGDDYIRRAAGVLRAVFRTDDVVARLGGDEFAVLLRGCDELTAARRVDDLALALEQSEVEASVGSAPLTVLRGLPAAVAQADRAMYEDKRRRRAARARLTLVEDRRRPRLCG